MALTEATKEAKAALKALYGEIETTKKKFADEEVAHWQQIERLTDEVVELTRNKKVLQTTNTTLLEDNRALKSEITVSKELLDGLKADETGLAIRVSDLRGTETELIETIDTLNSNVTSKTEQYETLKTDFNATEEKNNRELNILEQKKDALIQEIVDKREADNTVRDNLASWAKTLEEKDKNLRIREEQVNQQQKAISRNYNLLNL